MISKEKRAAYNRAYRAKRIEELRANDRARYAANKDAVRESGKVYRERYRDTLKAHKRAYYLKNRDRLIATHKARRSADPESSSRIAAKYYRSHADTIRAFIAGWKRRNKGLVNSHVMKRIAAKLQATPPWACDDAIRAIYDTAARMKASTGIPYVVDHLVPLQNPLVCGLHVAWNLQIITLEENSRKHNRLITEHLQVRDRHTSAEEAQ